MHFESIFLVVHRKNFIVLSRNNITKRIEVFDCQNSEMVVSNVTRLFKNLRDVKVHERYIIRVSNKKKKNYKIVMVVIRSSSFQD